MEDNPNMRAIFAAVSSSSESEEEVDEPAKPESRGLLDVAMAAGLIDRPGAGMRIALIDQVRKISLDMVVDYRRDGLERHGKDAQAAILYDKKAWMTELMTEIWRDLEGAATDLRSFLPAFKKIAVDQMRHPDSEKLIPIGRDLYIMAGMLLGIFRADEDFRPDMRKIPYFEMHNYHQEAETILANEITQDMERRQAEKRKRADDEEEIRKQLETEQRIREEEEMDKLAEEEAARDREMQLFDQTRYWTLLANCWTEEAALADCMKLARVRRLEEQREIEPLSSPPRSVYGEDDVVRELDLNLIKIEDDLQVHNPSCPDDRLTDAECAEMSEQAALLVASARRPQDYDDYDDDVQMLDAGDQWAPQPHNTQHASGRREWSREGQEEVARLYELFGTALPPPGSNLTPADLTELGINLADYGMDPAEFGFGAAAEDGNEAPTRGTDGAEYGIGAAQYGPTAPVYDGDEAENGIDGAEYRNDRAEHGTEEPARGTEGADYGIGAAQYGPTAPVYDEVESGIGAAQYGIDRAEYGNEEPTHGIRGTAEYGIGAAQYGPTAPVYDTARAEHGTEGAEYGIGAAQYGPTAPVYDGDEAEYSSDEMDISPVDSEAEEEEQRRLRWLNFDEEQERREAERRELEREEIEARRRAYDSVSKRAVVKAAELEEIRLANERKKDERRMERERREKEEKERKERERMAREERRREEAARLAPILREKEQKKMREKEARRLEREQQERQKEEKRRQAMQKANKQHPALKQQQQPPPPSQHYDNPWMPTAPVYEDWAAPPSSPPPSVATARHSRVHAFSSSGGHQGPPPPPPPPAKAWAPPGPPPGGPPPTRMAQTTLDLAPPPPPPGGPPPTRTPPPQRQSRAKTHSAERRVRRREEVEDEEERQSRGVRRPEQRVDDEERQSRGRHRRHEQRVDDVEMVDLEVEEVEERPSSPALRTRSVTRLIQQRAHYREMDEEEKRRENLEPENLEKYKHPLNVKDPRELQKMVEERETREKRKLKAMIVPEKISSGQDKLAGYVKLDDGDPFRFDEKPPRVNYGVRPPPGTLKSAMKHKANNVPVLLTDLHAERLRVKPGDRHAEIARTRLVKLQRSFASNPRKKVTFRDADDKKHEMRLYSMQADQVWHGKLSYDPTDDGYDKFNLDKPIGFLKVLIERSKLINLKAKAKDEVLAANRQPCTINCRIAADSCAEMKLKPHDPNNPYRTGPIAMKLKQRRDPIYTRATAKVRPGAGRQEEYEVAHRDYKILLAMKPMQDPTIDKVWLPRLRMYTKHAFSFTLNPALRKSACNAGLSHLVFADSLLDRVNTFRFPSAFFAIHQHPLTLSSSFRVLCNEVPLEKLLNIDWFIFAYGFDDIVFQGQNPRIAAHRLIEHVLAIERLYYIARKLLWPRSRDAGLRTSARFRVFKLPMHKMDKRIMAWIEQFNDQLEVIERMFHALAERKKVANNMKCHFKVLDWETPEIIKETYKIGATDLEREYGKNGPKYVYNCIDSFARSAHKQCDMRTARAMRNDDSIEFFARRESARVPGLSKEEHNRYY